MTGRFADIISYSTALSESFERVTGKPLVEADSPALLAHELYHAPFVLVAHGGEKDPIFCYANLTAQKLWNISWPEFTVLPSRLSAEEDERSERERYLKLAKEKGFIHNYTGVRITKDGKRFRISNCMLWNVDDKNGKPMGQAAMFAQWEWL